MATDISVVTTAWVFCASGGAIVPEIAGCVLETDIVACVVVPEIAGCVLETDIAACVVVLDTATWVVALEIGATHFVQIVDVEVISTVESTVVTFWVGLPPTGVTVVVIGQDVIVVCTLF